MKSILKTDIQTARRLKELVRVKTPENNTSSKSTLQLERKIICYSSTRIYNGEKKQAIISYNTPHNKTPFELWQKGFVYFETTSAASAASVCVQAVDDSRHIGGLNGYYFKAVIIGDYFPALVYGSSTPAYTDTAFNSQSSYLEGESAFKVRSYSNYDSISNTRLAILSAASSGGGGGGGTTRQKNVVTSIATTSAGYLQFTFETIRYIEPES